MSRQCAFCPTSADITLEHLWSEWIGEALKAYNIRHRRKSQTGEVITWYTDALNAGAKVVCGACNNGWMSELENKSKLVLEDMIVRCKPVTLAAIIAAITFKNMVVADYMKNNERPPFFTNRERWQFRRSLTLPKGLRMWFDSTPDSSHGLFKSYTLERPPKTAYRFEINIFTYGVGHFLSQSTCFKWKRKSLQKHAPLGILTQGNEWNGVFVPFWPANAGLIDWPGRSHLSYQLVETFVHRWNNAELS